MMISTAYICKVITVKYRLFKVLGCFVFFGTQLILHKVYNFLFIYMWQKEVCTSTCTMMNYCGFKLQMYNCVSWYFLRCHFYCKFLICCGWEEFFYMAVSVFFTCTKKCNQDFNGPFFNIYIKPCNFNGPCFYK